MNKQLSLADISVFNGEPAIADLRLAEALGYDDRHKIRDLIKRNAEELSGYGEVSATVAETSSRGGRPGLVYHLNEPQALTIAVLSKTENAAKVRKELITIFLAYRHGTLLSPAAPSAPPAPVDELTRKLAMITEARMTHGPAFAAALWRQLGLPEPGRLLPPPADPDALACLRHLLRSPLGGETVGALLVAAFKDDRAATQQLKGLKIEIKGDGFTVPNVHAAFAALYEGTEWARPFEALRKLPGAKPHLPYGGRFAGEYTFIPSHYLDEA